MKDYYSIIILFLVFTGIIFIYNLYVKKRNEKILRQEIKENFGKIHSKKFKGKINGLHKRLGGNVSEITANDLNLDEVLAKMNHTMSKMGLEFFYYRLRDLILDEDELTRLQEKRRLYEDKEEDLEDLQFHLGKLGYFKEDVLELIEEEIEVQGELEVLAKVFSFTALYILILFISLRAQAILFIFALLAVNTFIYKKFNEMALGRLEALVRLKGLFYVSEGLIKNKNQVFTEEINEIESILRELAPLKKSLRSFGFLTGNMELDFAETYRNILFLSEARSFSKSQKYFKKYREEIFRLYYLLGKIDCEIGIISLSKSYKTGEASFGNEILGKGLYNPLIKSPVPNDLDLDKSIILTGSNGIVK